MKDLPDQTYPITNRSTMRVFILTMPFPALPNALNLNVYILCTYEIGVAVGRPSSTIICIPSNNTHTPAPLYALHIRYTIIAFYPIYCKICVFTVRAVNKLQTTAASSVLL